MQNRMAKKVNQFEILKNSAPYMKKHEKLFLLKIRQYIILKNGIVKQESAKMIR